MSYFDPSFSVFTIDLGPDGLFGGGDDTILENPDYAPGSTVYFLVEGVDPYSTVEFTIEIQDAGADGIMGTEDDLFLTPESPPEEQGTWTMTDDDGDGIILASWTVDPDGYYLNETLRLTVVEDSDGNGVYGDETDRAAETFFTDGPPKLSANNHWENLLANTTDNATNADPWTKNAVTPSTASYIEGEYVPHQLEFIDLLPGTYYSLIINFDYYQNSSNAGGFIYIGEYNLTIDNPGNTTDPDFPDASTLFGDSTYNFDGGSDGVAPPAPTFYIENSDGLGLDSYLDLISVDYIDSFLAGSGDELRPVELVFKTADSFGSEASLDFNVYYSLRLALPDDIPGALGAADFSGNSLRVQTPNSDLTYEDFEFPEGITADDITELDAGANPFSTSAIFRGVLSGYKWDDTDGDGEWDEGDGEDGLAGVTIELWQETDGVAGLTAGDTLVTTTVTSDGTTDVNGDSSIDGAGFYEFSSAVNVALLSGEIYYVKEQVPTDKDQTYPDTPDYWGGFAISGTTPEYTGTEFVGGEGDGTLNFGNTLQGATITIIKDADPDDASPFYFTLSDDDGTEVDFNLTDNGGTDSISYEIALDGTGGDGKIEVGDTVDVTEDARALWATPTWYIDTDGNYDVNSRSGFEAFGIGYSINDFLVEPGGDYTILFVNEPADASAFITEKYVVCEPGAETEVLFKADSDTDDDALPGLDTPVNPYFAEGDGTVTYAYFFENNNVYALDPSQMASPLTLSDVTTESGGGGAINVPVDFENDGTVSVYQGGVALLEGAGWHFDSGNIVIDATVASTDVTAYEGNDTILVYFTTDSHAGQNSNTATWAFSTVGAYSDADTAGYFGVEAMDLSLTKTLYCGTEVDEAKLLGNGDEVIEGDNITYALELTNGSNVEIEVTLSDTLISDGELATAFGEADSNAGLAGYQIVVGAGATVSGAYTMTAGANTVDNTATASVLYEADCGTSEDEVEASVDYFGVINNLISLAKNVSVNGGGEYLPADEAQGPTMVVNGGGVPMFEVVITNETNVALEDIALSDKLVQEGGVVVDTYTVLSSVVTAVYLDDGVIQTLLTQGVHYDYEVNDNGTEFDLSDDFEELIIFDLGVGEQALVYYDGTFNLGQHQNTAFASVTYVADCGEVTDDEENDAFYYGEQGGFVTDSGLCDFDTNPNRDGDQFNVLFTPAFNDGEGYYKNSGTNPGQFYVNLFVTGEAGEEVTVCVTIPDEFVLRSGNDWETATGSPVHQYDYAVYDGDCINIDASPELGAFKLGAAPGEEGYTGVWIVDDDPNDGVYNLYSTIVLDDGQDYWNAHLDWDPQGSSGYGWNFEDPENNAVDADPNDEFDVEDILDHTDFNFEFNVIREGGEVDDFGVDTIENENHFKNTKGMGVYLTNTLTEEGFADQHIMVFDTYKGKTTKIMDFTTDGDGWGYGEHQVKGKERMLTVVVDFDNDGEIDKMSKSSDGTYTGDLITQVAMGGGAGRWAVAEIQFDDLGSYNPGHGDYFVDEFYIS